MARGRTKDEIVEAMRAALDRPGVDYNFSQPIKDRVEESISGHPRPGRRQDLRHRSGPHAPAAGPGEGHHRRDARRARRRHLPVGQRPAHRRGRDREAASRYGVSVRDVQDAIESGYGGKLATAMWEGSAGSGCASRRRSRTRAIRRRSGGWRSRRSTRGCSSRRWPGCTSTAGARRSTVSRGSGSSPSSATSRGATWAASSPRPRRVSPRP